MSICSQPTAICLCLKYAIAFSVSRPILFGEFLERIEFLFVANLVQKLDLDAIAIYVPIEIQNIYLEDSVDARHRRAGADAGHALKRFDYLFLSREPQIFL